MVGPGNEERVREVAEPGGRRDAVRSFGALTVALLAALGLANDGSAKKRKKRKKRGSGFATRRVESESSTPLSGGAGGGACAFADCGGSGKVVSCGYQTSTDPAQLVNTFVHLVAPLEDSSRCVACLERIVSTGSTDGATIQAIALCLA